MRKSIFLKIFSGYLLVIIILSGLILALSFTTIRNYYIDTTEKHLKDLGIVLKVQITPLLYEKKFQELDTFIKKLGKEIHTRITIVAPDGVVLSDSEENPKSMDNHRTRTEIAQALEGNIGRFLRVSETLKEQMLYIALPVEKDKKILGVLRLSLFLKDINTVISHTRNKILQISLLIITISLLIALIFSRSLSKPIKELSAAAKRIANEDFSARVLLKNNDELKELADNFNSMAVRMKTLFDELSRQKEELNSVISSLQEGFLVLDRDEKILLSNYSFKKIIQNNIVEEKFYWETFREPKFDELIKKIRGTKSNFTEEISLNNRVFLCSATFLGTKEEIAVVFHDITDIKNLEKIKTDFVSNISHELRTPLAAIKGFAETLDDKMHSTENKHYLDIIRRNTDRLINIINDLLFLSELEEKSTKLERVEVDLKIIVENITKIFEQRLKEKSLFLNLDVDSNLPPVKADPFKLEQMFINLIDNAVKYTENGGINISLKSKGDKVEITIEDTGIGIPEDHLPRIFERFYVVDKSRSKKLGGTGLGLSIVKHVVLLHNGNINVESSLGKWTKFVIMLPANPF
ncbi:MAG: ATP-binding protein [Proteobacteria bacterium]|nr:ATP-binding protein [Pseudomonadota bacterium]